MNSEAAQIAQRYSRWAGIEKEARYEMMDPAVYMVLQERERVLLRWIRECGIAPLHSKRLLEIGCGTGNDLLDFLRFGFRPANLTANDLLPERLEAARRLLPRDVQILPGNAVDLELPPGSLDVVYQSAVFTSILDADLQRDLAHRMWTWVKPGGGVLWYDFTYDIRRSPDVAGVPLRRIRKLFPEGQLEYWRLTVAPPLARMITRIHPALYTAANCFPFLRTHVLCWIRKPLSARAPRQCDPSELVCRGLNVRDLSSVALIHRAAFPRGTLTAFGNRCVEKYYAWHTNGPHAIAAIGLEQGGALIGHCILVRSNNFSGFLRHGIGTIVWRLFAEPSLFMRRGFVSRLRTGLGLLLGRGGATPSPATIRVLTIAIHPSFQGRGYAGILLQAATDTARKFGASHLALSVPPENQKAVRSYERDGWKRVLVNGVFTGNMNKSLAENRETISVPLGVLAGASQS